jgi:hypothetical protein
LCKSIGAAQIDCGFKLFKKDDLSPYAPSFLVELSFGDKFEKGLFFAQNTCKTG